MSIGKQMGSKTRRTRWIGVNGQEVAPVIHTGKVNARLVTARLDAGDAGFERQTDLDIENEFPTSEDFGQ